MARRRTSTRSRIGSVVSEKRAVGGLAIIEGESRGRFERGEESCRFTIGLALMRGSSTISIWDGWAISRGALNRGLLPSGFYALGEQFAGGLGPDVLTLQATNSGVGLVEEAPGGVALAAAPPKVRFRTVPSRMPMRRRPGRSSSGTSAIIA